MMQVMRHDIADRLSVGRWMNAFRPQIEPLFAPIDPNAILV